MPAKPALEPIYNKSRRRWRVDVPASKSATGKRVRVHFQSREGARDYIDRIDRIEAPDKALDPRLAEDANTARQRLADAGLDVTLAEAVRELIEAREILGEAGTIKEAVTAHRDAHAARTASQPVGEAALRYLELKETELRPVTLRGYRYTLKTALAPLAKKSMADVTLGDLDDIFGKLTPSTRQVHLRNVRAFWRWAAKPPRQWCETGAVDALEYDAGRSDGDTVTLSPAEVRVLMKRAEGYSGSAACAFAVAIFAGVRMAELERLRWRDISAEYVEIGATIAKKARRRLVPICPALAAWLDEHRPADAEPEDPVVGGNWREVSCAVRRLAGWDVEARILQKAPKATRGPWPKNAPRHTCASLLVATGEPLETLVFQFGHSGGHDLLRRHYVGRMTKKQAVEILSIGPKGTKIQTTQAA